MFKKMALGTAAAIAAFTALPAAAEARHRDGYYDQGRYESSYRGDRYARGDRYRNRNYANRNYANRNYRDTRRCKSGTTGTIVGGAAGALVGREVAGRRSGRTTGTILGGALGALAGRAVTRTC